MLKRNLLFICFLLSTAFVFGQKKELSAGYNLADIVSGDIYTELLKKGFASHTLGKGETELKLVPTTPIAQELLSDSSQDNSYDEYFVTENLHLVDKTVLKNNSKSSEADKDISMNKVSKVMRSISGMKGMMYYSHSDNKWEVLYTDAYTIGNADSIDPVADKKDGSADGKIIYTYMKDHSFSGCRYKLNYIQKLNELGVKFENIDNLKKAFITVATPGNMHNFMVIIDCGSSYLVYAAIQVKGPKFSILEKKLNNSLGSRIDALYNWFLYQF
ncbi:MAG: hypothetical protein LKF96_04950 [Treponema sp.]|jgi:hypothetical protein|nr:hypothetical protein [Treponema sp.]